MGWYHWWVRITVAGFHGFATAIVWVLPPSHCWHHRFQNVNLRIRHQDVILPVQITVQHNGQFERFSKHHLRWRLLFEIYLLRCKRLLKYSHVYWLSHCFEECHHGLNHSVLWSQNVRLHQDRPHFYLEQVWNFQAFNLIPVLLDVQVHRKSLAQYHSRHLDPWPVANLRQQYQLVTTAALVPFQIHLDFLLAV